MATKSIITNTKLHTLAQAISAKGGASLPMTVDQMAAAVAAIPTGGGGGGSSADKSVFFIDYDGTVLHGYDADEFRALTALPENPSHVGLTAQGWNWSKAGIEAQLLAHPGDDVWVGQKYITDDGKSRIYVHFEESRHDPYLGVGVKGTVEIDWGDGSPTETLTGNSLTSVKNAYHAYASGGDYVIKLGAVSVSYSFYGASNTPHILKLSTSASAYPSRVYSNAIKRIEMGRDAGIGNYAFYGCFSLDSITIPDEVTSIGTYALNSCFALKSITIPDGVTSIGNYTLQNCYSLASVSIPEDTEVIASGIFQTCGSLTSITIPAGVTSIKNDAFNGCHALTRITIPAGVTSIQSATFSYCYALLDVSIRGRVTDIGANAFSNCNSLASITIPEGVTSIAASAFQNCCGMAAYYLLPEEPPALANANAFSGIESDCIIYVPAGTLAAYQSATNWSTYASRMREMAA